MVTVVVPYRGGCPHREQAWERVQALYEAEHPDWHVVEAVAPEGPWCKATATAPAIEAAPDGVVIVADADCWTDGLAEAVHVVRSGLAAWAVPHLMVRRLGPDGGPGRRPYQGVQGGGVVVAHRHTFLDCPLDPRFTGWGQEDLSLACALYTLHGHPWRGVAELTHYWHPPEPRLDRKVGSPAGRALHGRYLKARGNPAAMRSLLEEFR